MSRSFLNQEELDQEGKSIQPPVFPITGEIHSSEEWPARDFSRHLTALLLARWNQDEDFKKAEPVWIGSAARGELCPRSDLDLLFCGDETSVANFVGRQQQQGLRIRSRMPVDLQDWSKGVEVPDILALLEGRGVTPQAQRALDEQKSLLRARIPKERKKWLKVLSDERSERETRFDSIANFLEPNLKYGPGGLRDLDQARQILKLFPERFEGAEHAEQILDSYSGFWLLLRQKLHLEGQGDVLSGTAQFDLAKWLGMEHKNFMREVQKGLSRVHFYSRWIFEHAKASDVQIKTLAKKPVLNLDHIAKLFKNDTSVLAQQHVRENIDFSFPVKWIPKNARKRGKFLDLMLDKKSGEDFVAAVFASRLMDKLVPEIKPLIGWVQHDQYHRYTADVHIQQACREWQRTLKKPQRLGKLAVEVRALKPKDRRILGWSLLCHDMMKGREGDHSELGQKWVRKELPKFGLPKDVVTEVEWLVEHHLELSQAAFRRNPRSSSTWTRLQNIGAEGDRLRRLAVFTAVDILATNPEAWNAWKSGLIADLLKALRSPVAQNSLKLQKELDQRKVKTSAEELDGFLIAVLRPQDLADDLKACVTGKDSQPAKVIMHGKTVWVRLHEKQDRPGVFADFVQKLYSLGLGIRHAAVHTLPEVGVYDWFEITTKKNPAQIKTWLANPSTPKAPPKVKFESITVVSQDEKEWVLSFKGLDQPGLLVAAARALADEKVSVLSARVHTWGRQVDDLFHIKPQKNSEELIRKLKTHFE